MMISQAPGSNQPGAEHDELDGEYLACSIYVKRWRSTARFAEKDCQPMTAYFRNRPRISNFRPNSLQFS